jgi:hypothetical protein
LAPKILNIQINNKKISSLIIHCQHSFGIIGLKKYYKIQKATILISLPKSTDFVLGRS